MLTPSHPTPLSLYWVVKEILLLYLGRNVNTFDSDLAFLLRSGPGVVMI